MGFPSLPKAVTLNDLELRNSPQFALFCRTWWIRRRIMSHWLKIDL